MQSRLDRSGVIKELKNVLDRATEGRIIPFMVGEHTDVIDELGVDSLNQLEIRFEIERVWNLEITDRQVRSLRTIGQAADLIIQLAVHEEEMV